jgi:hypothetical protein
VYRVDACRHVAGDGLEGIDLPQQELLRNLECRRLCTRLPLPLHDPQLLHGVADTGKLHMK